MGPVVALPPAVDIEPLVEVPPGWRPYVIQPGDTLAGIASCRGVEVETLARINAIAEHDLILAGANFHVPDAARCLAGSPGPLNRASSASREAAVARRSSPGSPHLLAEFERGQQLLELARAHYDAADFEKALRGAEVASQAFARAPSLQGVESLRARAHVLAAMASAGLEERDRAVAEFERAFALDPDAHLELGDRSPRLLELIQVARSSPTYTAR
jgi:tetratricopeptide (TPR) repeat protein